MTAVTNKLQVWHVPQVPGKAFEVAVPNEAAALLVVNALADQHLFLLECGLIDDYSNAVGVSMWDEHEEVWVDYYNEDLDMEWDEYVDTQIYGRNIQGLEEKLIKVDVPGAGGVWLSPEDAAKGGAQLAKEMGLDNVK